MSNDQRPEPYKGFGGVIGRTFAQSEPCWPARRQPPKGAPNVVVMLADDMGFSDLGCFGSEIATPHLDAIAARGLRYANFHTAPLCSPSRAALLTGCNSHAAGMGMIAQIDPGFPGYASELPENQPSIAEMMRANGYGTMMVGKWHLCRESDLSESGDKHSWPLQRGFDQFYGFLEALTNFHHPHRLYEGNSAIQTDQYPEGYYLTDDLTTRAIRMIKEVKSADPAKPFFMYFAHGAVHAPLHAKRADIEKYRSRYDIGWDRLREERLKRQKELGVVPEDVELPPRNSEPGEDVEAWDALPSDHQRLFARYMEVYAAMVDNVDQNVGRLAATLEELGELDNTIFIFTSDNGASREGREAGTLSYLRDSTSTQTDRKTAVSERELAQLDAIGGPTSWPHYPRGWGMACNTPFRLYKVTAYRGGNQVPFILSWPNRLHDKGKIVRNQYTHVTDLLPTLVELTGIELITQRAGLEAEPLAGRSFVNTIEDPHADTNHNEQYIEVVGHRSFYRDGWEITAFHLPKSSFSEDRWQLFDIASDPNQRIDLAEKYPEKVDELVKAWEDAAWENQVFPLEDGTGVSEKLRPPSDRRFETQVRIFAGTPTLERWRSCKLIAGRPFKITVDFSFTGQEEGVLLAHGGQAGGYVLFVEHGSLCFIYHDGHSRVATPMIMLDAPTNEVIISAEIPVGGKWNFSLQIDGVEAGRLEGCDQLGGFLPFEGIDVGIDRRSPVSWDLYTRHGAFPYTGEIRSVTYSPGALPEGAADLMEEQARRAGLNLD